MTWRLVLAKWGVNVAAMRTLRGEGIDTLVVAGLTTECCIDSSVRDAFEPREK